MTAQATIKDVAERSGVSYMTVSRVVNGEANVRETTRLRVEAAIAELEYRPDHAARSLRRGRTQTLGIVVVRWAERFLTEPYVDEVMAGIADRAARSGYALVLDVVDHANHAPRLSSLTDGRTDGAIVIDGREDNPLQPLLERARLPCVVLANRPSSPALNWIHADFREGAATLVRHLLDLGHRRIAHLAGNPGTVSRRERLLGYEQALAAAGIAPDPALVVAAGHLRHHGYRAMQELLGGRAGFSAVFAVNDLTALGAMECLQQRGLRLPDDVSVVGFDDIYLAPFATPPLTTTRLPAYEMGEAAADRIIDAVEGGDSSPVAVEFPLELRIRESTAPPPGMAGASPD